MNKKSVSIVLLVCILFLSILVFADEMAQYQISKSNAEIFFDGNEVAFDLPIVTVDGRTYVPLRETAEKFNTVVDWNENENKIMVSNADSQKTVFEMSIFPTSTFKETYLVKLFYNGNLVVSKGDRTCELITANDYLIPEKTNKTSLTYPQMQELMDLVNKINDEDLNFKLETSDGWAVTLLYNNGIYEYNLGDMPFGKPMSDHIEELINKIIEYSPTKIDIHGWA